MKLLPRAFQVLCHSRLLLECQICFRLPAGGFEREGQGRLRREPLPGLGDLWDLQTFKFKVCGCWCILCQVLQFQFGDVGSAAGAMQSACGLPVLANTNPCDTSFMWRHVAFVLQSKGRFGRREVCISSLKHRHASFLLRSDQWS